MPSKYVFSRPQELPHLKSCYWAQTEQVKIEHLKTDRSTGHISLDTFVGTSSSSVETPSWDVSWGGAAELERGKLTSRAPSLGVPSWAHLWAHLWA